MLTIWRFTDGKRGHENQTLGLVEALCQLTPCKVETLSIAKGWPFMLDWLFRRFPPGDSLTKPDLIVGAGHATHWPMLAARRACGGKIAVLMKPSLPLSWFDRVVAPEHDVLPKRAGVISTIGPINRIRPGQLNPQSGLMLIGGPSSEYGWSETALLKQIHLIALHQPEVIWHLTTSRRTPANFIANVEKLNLPKLHAVDYSKVGPDWLPDHLAQSAQVWVTPDSASMVYEALTSGAAVGCFELPFLEPGRVARGLDKLTDEKRLTSFTDWQATGKLQPDTHLLNEAERCAKVILQWLKKD
jgi:hypothetical protein